MLGVLPDSHALTRRLRHRAPSFGELLVLFALSSLGFPLSHLWTVASAAAASSPDLNRQVCDDIQSAK